MPSKFFYALVGSQILGIARTNTNKTQFMKSVNTLLNRVKKQDCKRKQVIKILNKMYRRHINYFQKFVHTAEQLTYQVT